MNKIKASILILFITGMFLFMMSMLIFSIIPMNICIIPQGDNMNENKELLSKSQIEKKFHDWIEGFSNNTRFDISIMWESSICVQMPYTKEKNIHKHQMLFKE